MPDAGDRTRLTYAPALDGLRAVACLSVMLYHAKILSGGFLGVDVFFTLSGFLITSLLVAELRAAGAVDLRAFWRRRIFRIVPLLATVSVTLFVWASVHGGDVGRATILGALTSLLFCVNWLASRVTEGAGALTANWSVALEEQFYLVWPVVVSLLFRLRRREKAIAGLVAGAAAALAVHRALIVPGSTYARVWFGIDTQADALLAGCAVALGLRCRSRLSGAVAGAGLGALLVFCHENAETLRFGLPAAILCTAVLVPVLADRGGWLAWGPLRAVGRRSYGLYLWGTAINFLAFDVYGLRGLPLLLVVFPATFAVTEVTYQFVERPLRRLGRRPAERSRRSPASATAPGGPLRLSPHRP
ncbi:MAG TPA: acyltransferase [Acidimicrobiia bacterium]|nr:acyltransferase [Acidimicrobiia bacterium]